MVTTATDSLARENPTNKAACDIHWITVNAWNVKIIFVEPDYKLYRSYSISYIINMTLLLLANEILLSISEALGSEKDINALAQVNRRCFQLLDPHLYRYNVRNNGSSALFWAAKRGELNTIIRLSEEGAHIHSTARQHNLGVVTPLHVAVRHGHFRIASILIMNGMSPRIEACNGHTPLGLAIAARSVATVALLIKLGADARQRFPAQWGGSTALHFASFIGAKSIVKLLLDSDADIEALDLKQQTPLHWAVTPVVPESAIFPPAYRLSSPRRGERIWKGGIGTVRLLLDHNANTEVEDVFGHSPRELAKSSRDRMLSKTFEDDTSFAFYTDNLRNPRLQEWQRRMKEPQGSREIMELHSISVRRFDEVASVGKGPPKTNATSIATIKPEISSTKTSLEKQGSARLEWAQMRKRAEGNGQSAAKPEFKPQIRCSHSSLVWANRKGRTRLRVDCEECSGRHGKYSFQCPDCNIVLCKSCRNETVLQL